MVTFPSWVVKKRDFLGTLRDHASVSSALYTSIVGKISPEEEIQAADLLAVEEPLEIRLGYGSREDRQHRSIAVTMRSPGNDQELAVGFLFSEGIIQRRADILKVLQISVNVVRIDLHEELDFELGKLQRNFYTTSSCGVCGKSAIEAVRVSGGYRECIPAQHPLAISREAILRMPPRLRAAQRNFQSTGGMHAAALFTLRGELLSVREDVGRHNALDKLIGSEFFQERLPLTGCMLLVSGRASFELVQKAALAGIPCMAALGAPSSLAVNLADENSMLLVGFLRKDGFNVYTQTTVAP